MELSEARAQWRGLEAKAFLDAACCGILPQPAKRALIEFVEMCEICPQESSSAYHIAMDTRRIEPVHEAARLLNAGVEETRAGGEHDVRAERGSHVPGDARGAGGPHLRPGVPPGRHPVDDAEGPRDHGQGGPERLRSRRGGRLREGDRR